MDGQPTQKILDFRRPAEYLTPTPIPKKQKAAPPDQARMVFVDPAGLSTAQQEYDPTPLINELRRQLNLWRRQGSTGVTAETARLLDHWRNHQFATFRPFFCQIEAVETSIWLTEVAPTTAAGRRFLDHLADANRSANPELSRLALKLATGAGGPPDR